MTGGSGSSLREILASFFVEVNDEELLAAGKHVEGFIGKMRAVIPVLTEAFAVKAIGEFIGETIELAAHTDDLANRLGVTTDELQQFQFAAKLAGVEGETAAHSLGFLNKNVGEALTGSKEAQETFAKMGIALRDSSGHARATGDILGDVSDALAKMPDQQTRAAYAVKLFGREGQALLPILSQGKEKLNEVNKEFAALGGGMSEEFVTAAKETADQFDQLKLGAESLKSRIVGALLPAVNWLIAKAKAILIPLIDWLDHTHALKSGLAALAGLLAGKVVFSILRLMRVMGLLKATAYETLKAFLGFALPLIGIGLLYLAFDDFFTLLDGGDSEIGHLLEGLGGVEGKDKYVQDLKDSWQQLLDLFGIGGPEIDGVNDKLTTTQKVVEFLGGAFYEVVTIAKTLLDTLVAIATTIVDVTEGLGRMAKAFMTGPRQAGALWDTVKKAFGSDTGKDADKAGDIIGNDFKDIWNPGNHPATARGPGYDPRLDPTSNPATNEDVGTTAVGAITYGAPAVGPAKGSVKVGKIEVHVTAGKNPEETGKRVAQSASTELEKAMRDAVQSQQAQ